MSVHGCAGNCHWAWNKPVGLTACCKGSILQKYPMGFPSSSGSPLKQKYQSYSCAAVDMCHRNVIMIRPRGEAFWKKKKKSTWGQDYKRLSTRDILYWFWVLQTSLCLRALLHLQVLCCWGRQPVRAWAGGNADPTAGQGNKPSTPHCLDIFQDLPASTQVV